MRTAWLYTAAGVTLVVAVHAGISRAGGGATLEERVASLEARVAALEGRPAGGGAAARGTSKQRAAMVAVSRGLSANLNGTSKRPVEEQLSPEEAVAMREVAEDIDAGHYAGVEWSRESGAKVPGFQSAVWWISNRAQLAALKRSVTETMVADVYEFTSAIEKMDFAAALRAWTVFKSRYVSAR